MVYTGMAAWVVFKLWLSKHRCSRHVLCINGNVVLCYHQAVNIQTIFEDMTFTFPYVLLASTLQPSRSIAILGTDQMDWAPHKRSGPRTILVRFRFASASTQTWRQSVAFAMSSRHVGGNAGPNLNLTIHRAPHRRTGPLTMLTGPLTGEQGPSDEDRATHGKIGPSEADKTPHMWTESITAGLAHPRCTGHSRRWADGGGWGGGGGGKVL